MNDLVLPFEQQTALMHPGTEHSYDDVNTPMDPPNVLSVLHQGVNNSPERQDRMTEEKVTIDNTKRFQYLFLGLIAVFMSSGYGTYVVFGLYLQVLYGFYVKNIVDVFVVGTAAGLGFAGMAGFLFDYIGHRITIAYASVFCFIGMLCMGIAFDGHIKINEANMDGLFFLMNAGGYTVDMVAIIVSVTHFPRNRGMVCGLYKSMGGLAASFFSCLFRGYLKSKLPNMFYVYIAVTVVFAIITLIFYGPAPWVNFRFHRAVRVLRTKPEDKTVTSDRLAEIHERMAEYVKLKIPFLKYHLPKRRIRITFFVLMLLNMFMTTQILLIAYKEITNRGILNLFSTIALILVLLLTVLVWPFDFLDEEMDYTEDSVDMDKEGHALHNDRTLTPELNPLVSAGQSVTSSHMHTYDITRQVLNGYFTPQASGVFGGPSGDQAINTEEQVVQSESEDLEKVVLFELDKLTPDNRLALNYDSVTELIKYRGGALEALCSPEFWILMFLSFVVWSSGLILTNNLFIQILYTSIDKKAMATNTYYLYSALSGILIAAGRMAIGMAADDVMPILRVKLGLPFNLPFTLLLIVAPWLMFFGLLLMLVVPGIQGMLAAYVFISFGFGLVTSTVPYAVTCFFSFEHVGLGKMYGMCLFAVGAGVAVFYRGVFYTEYNKKAYPLDFILPQVRGVCISGKKDCAQTFLIVLLIFNFVAGILSVVLHALYQRKIHAMTKVLVERLEASDPA